MITTDGMKDLINKYGEDHQKLKSIEELSELIRAISRNDKDMVVEEMADVYIMLFQLRIIYDVDRNDIDFWLKKKIEREKSRNGFTYL